jgi:hypothetical protein
MDATDFGFPPDFSDQSTKIDENNGFISRRRFSARFTDFLNHDQDMQSQTQFSL